MKRKRHLLLLLFGAMLMSFSALSLTSCDDDDEEYCIAEIIPYLHASGGDNFEERDGRSAYVFYEKHDTVEVEIIKSSDTKINDNEVIFFNKHDLSGQDFTHIGDLIKFRIVDIEEIDQSTQDRLYGTFPLCDIAYPRYFCEVEPVK
ncbi:MAG: hypothetical protein IJ669_03105 [Prevotella sp.]|nr:hypothetical protein [Prevotella sp.]